MGVFMSGSGGGAATVAVVVVVVGQACSLFIESLLQT